LIRGRSLSEACHVLKNRNSRNNLMLERADPRGRVEGSIRGVRSEGERGLGFTHLCLSFALTLRGNPKLYISPMDTCTCEKVNRMSQDIVTVELNAPLCARIEEFLQQHGLNESLEDFVVTAGRSLLEQLASRQDARHPQNGHYEEEYSDDAVERASDALNKPLSDSEKSQTLKELAACWRRLKNESGRGGSI